MLLIIIAVVILLIILVGLWYVWATPAPADVPPPTPEATTPEATTTNAAGIGSLPAAAAPTPPPAPVGYTWDYIDNGALSGGSGLYGYKSGADDVFPTWESCRDRCAGDETCGGFWWTNPSHQGCYYQGKGSLSFMPGGGGGTKAGIKRF